MDEQKNITTTDSAKKSFQKKDFRQKNERLQTLIAELPPFCIAFFVGINPTTSILTRINYAYDLRVFFHFLSNYMPSCKGKSMQDFQPSDIDTIKPEQIEQYMMFLDSYEFHDVERENHELGKKRKMASLRSFYKYYYKKQLIQHNPVTLVDMPKVHEKAIIRLEVDEIAKLLDSVDSGSALTKRQQKYHTITRLRDIALLTVFLGTGIRVSECIGLNIQDVDFETNGFIITRKGGTQTIIYFWNEVEKALREYLEVRKKITTQTGHEDALFLSMQNRRITARAVQLLVKKYSRVATPLKRITPHKLRSTYGTSLYRETGDIYLVADVLGHKDVNTTRKHYAAISETQRRVAAKAVILRDDKPIKSENE